LDRRALLILGSAAIAWPLAARAQQKVIGYLSATSPEPAAPFQPAFREGLSETGYVVTKNVMIEYRWAEDHFDRLPALAAELVSRKVDLIVTAGGPASAVAAKHATSTIPILFSAVGDPIAAGLVSSLAHPGGNVTGFSILVVELNPKRFELLCELVPNVRVIALLVNPATASSGRVERDVRDAARLKGVQLLTLKASTKTEIDAAFASLAQQGAGALLVGSDPVFNSRREQLVALASRYAVPAIYEWRESAAIGGLMSYGPSQISISYQAGVYAGRILNGENPGDLPVQEPTKFELVINLKTAKTLGLTVPQSLLARADEVIE
jgi:putative tryptophan/tyrosine transport system substrate-binding protein